METASGAASATALEADLASTESLIERQFPVARLSMESYKERTAKQSQTLTGLGKWWGRKPLVLVRACLLGLLMPPSSDPARDSEIFLKLMTMDAEGVRSRKNKNIAPARVLAAIAQAPPTFRNRFLDPASGDNKPALRKLSKPERAELQAWVFDRMPYGEKLEYCARPEQVEGPSAESWKETNQHLGTHASSLSELVVELGT